MPEQRFAFDVDPRFRVPLLVFGVTPAGAEVVVDDERLVARFGLFSLATPRSNVVGASVTGPHRWPKAVGPRLSLADRGVTFGTNARRHVCVEFAEPVRALDPTGRLRHPSASLSVVDCDGLVAALQAV